MLLCLYTQAPLHTDTFTHRHSYTQTLLDTEAFTQRRFYTQRLLHKDAFTRRCLYTQAPLHTDTFTHRRFYTQTLLHTDAFTHRGFYTQRLLHTDAFRHMLLDTQRPHTGREKARIQNLHGNLLVAQSCRSIATHFPQFSTSKLPYYAGEPASRRNPPQHNNIVWSHVYYQNHLYAANPRTQRKRTRKSCIMLAKHVSGQKKKESKHHIMLAKATTQNRKFSAVFSRSNVISCVTVAFSWSLVAIAPPRLKREEKLAEDRRNRERERRCKISRRKIWRCKVSRRKIWRCKISWRKMWRCKISWRKMWRCKISWRKIWRCKISWRKIWRCIISAPFSRRTLCSGALGKNLHGLLWLYSFRCLLLLRHPAKPGTCMIRACNPCIWINLVSQLSQSVHWQVHHGSFFYLYLSTFKQSVLVIHVGSQGRCHAIPAGMFFLSRNI